MPRSGLLCQLKCPVSVHTCHPAFYQTTSEANHPGGNPGANPFFFVNSHTNATRIGWHLWEIDLRFASGLQGGERMTFDRKLKASKKGSKRTQYSLFPYASVRFKDF